MMNIRIAAILLMFSLLSPSVFGARVEKDTFVIEGTVVAKYIDISTLICQDGWEMEIIILVRIESRIKGNEPHQYIRVHYSYICGQTDPLPKEIYNANNLWQFTLTRSQKCDGPLKGELYPSDDPEKNKKVLLPRIHRTTHAEQEQIPYDTQMHCYSLKPDGFKLIKEMKPQQSDRQP